MFCNIRKSPDRLSFDLSCKNGREKKPISLTDKKPFLIHMKNHNNHNNIKENHNGDRIRDVSNIPFFHFFLGTALDFEGLDFEIAIWNGFGL
ncbi:hypothetical protein RCL_jg10350.t1 [Rhizophagus clarus]|uniref:Uncharacterized protein n=1 Tax=Rhizophagus clarus TaxID=94130 RepID=A0A8H3KRZ3_9GLOM|nr:hypothetical protein RCL_jg10350.t1 [Rhizophagus clarus]